MSKECRNLDCVNYRNSQCDDNFCKTCGTLLALTQSPPVAFDQNVLIHPNSLLTPRELRIIRNFCALQEDPEPEPKPEPDSELDPELDQSITQKKTRSRRVCISCHKRRKVCNEYEIVHIEVLQLMELLSSVSSPNSRISVNFVWPKTCTVLVQSRLLNFGIHVSWFDMSILSHFLIEKHIYGLPNSFWFLLCMIPAYQNERSTLFVWFLTRISRSLQLVLLSTRCRFMNLCCKTPNFINSTIMDSQRTL